MDINTNQFPVISLYNLAADKIVTSLKTKDLKVETLSELNIPQLLINKSLAKILDREIIFRDIKSRSCIINANRSEFNIMLNAIAHKEFSKPGPAYLPNAYPEYDYNSSLPPFVNIILLKQTEFFIFICDKNFCHENRYFAKQIFTKIFELLSTIDDDMILNSLFAFIDAIDVLNLYKSNEASIKKKVIEVIELIEDKQIIDYTTLYDLSNNLYGIARGNSNEALIVINEHIEKLY